MQSPLSFSGMISYPTPTPSPPSAPFSMTGVGGDYLVYYNDEGAEQWLLYDGYWLNKVAEMKEQGFYTARLGFNFIEVENGRGPSLMDYDKLDIVLGYLDGIDIRAILIMQNYAQSYPTNYLFSQDFHDNWINFVTRYEGDNRIAAVSLYGEVAKTDFPGHTAYEVTQTFANLVKDIHKIDPDRVVVFPLGELYYTKATNWINDLQLTGMLSEPNVVFDIVHPYYFESNDFDYGLSPEEKVQYYVDNWIAPCVDAFGNSRCYSGETFCWTPGDPNVMPQPMHSTYTYDLQRRYLTSMINSFTDFEVSFCIWAWIGTPDSTGVVTDAIAQSNYSR